MVRSLLFDRSTDGAPPTIGVVAFSEAQQTAIEEALLDLAADDPFRPRLEAELSGSTTTSSSDCS